MAETETEWAVRWTYDYGERTGSHITLCRNEAEARRDARKKPLPKQTITIIRRQVTYGDWQDAQ